MARHHCCRNDGTYAHLVFFLCSRMRFRKRSERIGHTMDTGPRRAVRRRLLYEMRMRCGKYITFRLSFPRCVGHSVPRPVLHFHVHVPIVFYVITRCTSHLF